MARIDPIARAQAMRERGTDPQVPYPGVDKPWAGICQTCQQETRSSYTSVVTKGQGVCFHCGQRKSSRAAAEKRRVSPEAAEGAVRAAGAEPLEPFPGTQAVWRCRCQACGREIDVWYSSVAYAGNGACLYCSGTMRIPDEEARAEMLALGLEPLVAYPGLNSKWRSRCLNCKKTVDPTLSNARKTKSKCRYCAQRATDPEIAVSIMEDAGLRPLEPFPGSVTAPWPAEHEACGKRVEPTLDKVIQRRRAPCQHCARFGFKPDQPGYLYLLVHEEFGAGKIGICNESSERIRAHERKSWTLVRRQLLPGALALGAEQLGRFFPIIGSLVWSCG
ncbi:hypothetical protein ACGFZP_31920 [Kitasatospora sp. NPDC048239]|uniref:hypothetical protein n=1 Tax=Kitasatospora sp. NPDC048239 TaxID=3364046 RepID=UPI00371184B0